MDGDAKSSHFDGTFVSLCGNGEVLGLPAQTYKRVTPPLKIVSSNLADLVAPYTLVTPYTDSLAYAGEVQYPNLPPGNH